MQATAVVVFKTDVSKKIFIFRNSRVSSKSFRISEIPHIFDKRLSCVLCMLNIILPLLSKLNFSWTLYNKSIRFPPFCVPVSILWQLLKNFLKKGYAVRNIKARTWPTYIIMARINCEQEWLNFEKRQLTSQEFEFKCLSKKSIKVLIRISTALTCPKITQN